MKRKERQEIRHDRFVESLLLIGRGMEQHRRPLVVAGLGVVVFAGGVIWLFLQMGAARADRWDRLHSAEEELAAAMNKPDDAERSKAVDTALARLKKIQDDLRGTAAGRQALSDLAEAEYQEGRYQDAIESYRQIIADPDSPGKMKQLV